MKTLQATSFVRLHLAASLAVLLAGCGQAEPLIVSSTLQEPAKPGDGYGLVKTSDARHDIRRLAVAGNSLFFQIAWDGMYSMPKYGGAIASVDRDTKADFLGLATSGDTVLWLKAHLDSNDFPDDFLLRRPVDGGATTRLRGGNLATIGFNNFDLLITDTSHIYFVTEANLAVSGIDVTPIAGGAAERVPLPEGQSVGPVTVAGDYPSVYFTFCQAAMSTCVLEKADLPTGAAQVVASVSDYAQIVGLDESAVYLLDGERLWSIARADGTETELIGSAAGIHPISPAVIDGQSVYFFGFEPEASLPAMRLMSVSKAGGPPTIIGSDELIHHWVPWDLAVDDQFVFVLTSPMTYDGGNEILAFPKTLPPSP
jgi:hypothetical protein